MNFVYISPTFPKNFYNFCDRLKNKGVTVLAIGDTPYEQLTDEVVEMRQSVIKDFYTKNLFRIDDLLKAINCIEVDCKDQGKCCNISSNKLAKHFEIPQLLDGIGDDAIYYIGSVDRHQMYSVYFEPSIMNFYKYRMRGSESPYVYIEKTPNENNMYDGWIFNAPFVKYISVIGIFKDLRQLTEYNCCKDPEFLDFGYISQEVKNRLTKQKLQYYRQNYQPPASTSLMAK